MKIPEVFNIYFWDVDFNNLDIDLDYFFILERILKFGRAEAIKWLLDSFKDNQIIEVIKNSIRIDLKTATFWMYHFNLKEEEIRCLNRDLTQNCFY